MLKSARIAVAGICCLAAATPQARANDPVSEWNQIAVAQTLNASPAQAPVQQTRTMAIVQVAVHDAINAITGQYGTYGAYPPAPTNASPEAAAIAAAHEALKGLFSSQTHGLDTLFVNSLTANNLSINDPGIAFGRSVALAILAQRATDGAAQAQFDYLVPGAGQPGVWIRLNNAPALLPGWGNVTPFVLRSSAQFRPDPPPLLTSEQWAKDYTEVHAIGAGNSQLRTTEQTGIANFWRASPTAIWNAVLTQVLEARPLDLASKARVFALLYLSAGDSSIACWEAKYTYNFWRPFPAILGADTDGNPGTLADPGWTPLLPTPPHPEYPSAHACNSSAMGFVLKTMFDDDPGVQIELTFFQVTRRWNTFDEPIQEVIDARVYSGIHYRTSDEVGARLGRQVAQFVMTHALRPSKGSWK